MSEMTAALQSFERCKASLELAKSRLSDVISLLYEARYAVPPPHEVWRHIPSAQGKVHLVEASVDAAISAINESITFHCKER